MRRVLAILMGLVVAGALSGLSAAAGAAGGSAGTVNPPTRTVPNTLLLPLAPDTDDLLPPAEDAPADPQERIDRLTELVRNFLDSQEFVYSHVADSNRFDIGMNLEGGFEGCDGSFYIYDDMIAFACWADDFSAPQEVRANLAAFIARINFDRSYSTLRLSFEDGSVSSRAFILVEKALPTVSEIQVAFAESLFILSDYGEGIKEVALNGGDPGVVYERVAAALEND